MDGVLGDFNTSYYALLQGIRKIDTDTDPAMPPTWHWPTQLGWTAMEDQAGWTIVRQSPSFWLNMEPYEGAVSVLAELWGRAQTGDDIYFITHREGFSCKRQSELWLQRHAFQQPTVIVSGRKGDIARGLGLEVFIDDKPSNIDDVCSWSPQTRSYLLDRPWNKDYQVTRATRVRSIEEMFDIEGI